MILSDETILKLIRDEKLIEVPEDVDTFTKIQPASYDLRLGNEFIFPDSDPIVTNKPIVIPSHTFVLATTLEKVNIPNYICGFVEGRSSVGRTGLFIHNAGLIDPGFSGQITLELFNAFNDDISITPGMRICQIVFHMLDKPCTDSYNGKYQNQIGTTPTKIYLDEELK